MPKSPCEFQNTEELVKSIMVHRPVLQRWFAAREHSLSEIAENSVEQNTYRGLHGYIPGPKAIYKEWALEQLQQNAFQQIANFSAQAEYDKWLNELAGRLRRYWPTNPQPLGYGRSRKLTNLLLKVYILWDGIQIIVERG